MTACALDPEGHASSCLVDATKGDLLHMPLEVQGVGCPLADDVGLQGRVCQLLFRSLLEPFLEEE